MGEYEQFQNLNMKCAADPLFAGKIWVPEFFPNKFAGFHYDIIHRIKNRPKNIDTIVIECMRGAAKTKLVSSLLSAHDSVYDKLGFTIIASSSDEAAQRIVRDAKTFIISEHFQMMFPKAKIVQDRKMLIEVKDDDGAFEFQIMSRGRGSQATGLTFKQHRIDRFLGDDLEHPEEAYSQDLVDGHERYINEVIRPALTPETGLIVLIGTPFAHDCTTKRFSRKRGVMTIRYPILVDNRIGGIFIGDGDCEKRIGEDMSEMLGIEEGKSIWEDRFPTKWVEEERDKAYHNGVSDFGSWVRQFMLDPITPGSIRFDFSKINYIDPNSITKKLNIFILCDFAYSKQVWADDSAIVVVGVDDDNNFYVLHAEKDKWGDTETTERLINTCLKYKDNLRLVGVEVRSYGFVQKRMIEAKKQHNVNFGLVELKPGNRTKPERIKALTHVVEDGRIYMVRGLRKLEDEMYRFKGEDMKRGDDLMDALAYILDVSYKPETTKTKDEQDKEENHLIWQTLTSEAREKEKMRDKRPMGGMNDSRNFIDNFF
jgi:predicted phage terminase large subunit-like protein